MNCCDDRKQLVTKLVSLAVGVYCACLLAGCSEPKPEVYVLENGQSVVSQRNRDGSLRTIRLLSEDKHDVLRIEIASSPQLRRVTFLNRNGEMIGETTIHSVGVSNVAKSVHFKLEQKSGKIGPEPGRPEAQAGRWEERIWTYEGTNVIYSEQFMYNYKDAITSKRIRGPFNRLLEDFNVGDM